MVPIGTVTSWRHLKGHGARVGRQTRGTQAPQKHLCVHSPLTNVCAQAACRKFGTVPVEGSLGSRHGRPPIKGQETAQERRRAPREAFWGQIGAQHFFKDESDLSVMNIVASRSEITSFGWSAWMYRLRQHVHRENSMGDNWVVVSQLAARTE